MEILDRFKQTIDKNLHLQTPPIAIKLLKCSDDVPIDAGRPLRDIGIPIRPCESWHFARHMGLSIVMLEEDFSTSCPHGMFIFGILEPIQSWLDGALAYELYTGSREAAANMERHIFRLEAGKYKGIALAPLGKVDFIPDVLMIYCNPRQALRFVTAAAWKSGEPLKFSMAARALCSDGVIQPFQIGQPALAIPCGGDREHGRTQDNEVVFTTPLDGLEEMTRGLEAFEWCHRVENLGRESEIRRRYNKMAKTLDQKMGVANY